MSEFVRVLSTLALKGAVSALAGQYEADGGARIEAGFAPTLALLERLRAGEAADVVILTREGLEEVVHEGRVASESCVDLARSYVGLAVRAGEVHPDISSEPALRAALLGARAVAYSRLGASGILFAKLIERMGIAADQCSRGHHPAGLYGRAPRRRGSGPRCSADQRVEAGVRHRGDRTDTASVADASGVFRRAHAGIAQGRSGGPAVALSGVAAGRSGPA
jgi:hypothetical protein